MPHPLMVLAASTAAVTRFKVSGITAVIFLLVVIAIAAAVFFAFRAVRRSRPAAPPDDWERKPVQRG